VLRRRRRGYAVAGGSALAGASRIRDSGHGLARGLAWEVEREIANSSRGSVGRSEDRGERATANGGAGHRRDGSDERIQVEQRGKERGRGTARILTTARSSGAAWSSRNGDGTTTRRAAPSSERVAAVQARVDESRCSGG